MLPMPAFPMRVLDSLAISEVDQDIFFFSLSNAQIIFPKHFIVHVVKK